LPRRQRVSTAHNSFAGIEHLTDDELADVRDRCERGPEAEKIAGKSVEQPR
jgi:low affinity Fe/Cu permease